jgi:hypothetical protein
MTDCAMKFPHTRRILKCLSQPEFSTVFKYWVMDCGFWQAKENGRKILAMISTFEEFVKAGPDYVDVFDIEEMELDIRVVSAVLEPFALYFVHHLWTVWAFRTMQISR